MNYGLHLSASGVLTSLHRQDVHANNLANASTVGFKRDLANVTQRDPESIEGPHPEHRHPILDMIGGGFFSGPQHISFAPGALERTNNPLDIALGLHYTEAERMRRSEDTVEGPRAFAEKRKPNWKAR